MASSHVELLYRVIRSTRLIFVIIVSISRMINNPSRYTENQLTLAPTDVARPSQFSSRRRRISMQLSQKSEWRNE